jgi:hypothetical protein
VALVEIYPRLSIPIRERWQGAQWNVISNLDSFGSPIQRTPQTEPWQQGSRPMRHTGRAKS